MYVFGVLDGFSIENMLAKDGGATARACVVEGTNTGQVIGMVLDYLDTHPEDMKQSGAWIIRMVLNINFPCN